MAFVLYIRLKPSEMDDTGRDVQQLAKSLHRTPNAVTLKIMNIAANDANRVATGRKGMSHGSKLDRSIWEDYAERGSSLVEEGLLLLTNTVQQQYVNPEFFKLASSFKMGGERAVEAQRRINQDYFRKILIENYQGRCCLTGIGINQLLIASHIKPWADSTDLEKTAAANGLLLNAFHDKAFDNGLMTIDDDYRMRVSPAVRHSEVNDTWLWAYDKQEIELPQVNPPSHEFIEYHNKHVFKTAA
ncbi:restriction endonuclease [Bifidobacterium primatium]|uniref:Restriction endonuclease n=1 Tax=Bifidobacterium primatium TaxID=2045438 RepID=A0A2M9HBD4_9BIFI|nr:HNH endonuclease [Bifidobacterium primatium]PJM74118.1 restriction endonuclease [Bifidobacterium primatium]